MRLWVFSPTLFGSHHKTQNENDMIPSNIQPKFWLKAMKSIFIKWNFFRSLHAWCKLSQCYALCLPFTRFGSFSAVEGFYSCQNIFKSERMVLGEIRKVLKDFLVWVNLKDDSNGISFVNCLKRLKVLWDFDIVLKIFRWLAFLSIQRPSISKWNVSHQETKWRGELWKSWSMTRNFLLTREKFN